MLLIELATEPLRTAIEACSVVGLRATIPVAVREGLVDVSMVKVSEGGVVCNTLTFLCGSAATRDASIQF